MMNINEVINRAMKKDDAAFTELYNYSYPSVRKEALKFFNEFDAEDMIQNVYFKIYTNLHTLNEPDRFIAWSVMICRNTCVNEYNRRINEANKMFFAPDYADDDEFSLSVMPAPSYRADINPEAFIECSELKQTLANAIAGLSTPQQRCLNMWMADYSTKEIHNVTNYPEGTIRCHISRGKQNLKNALSAMAAMAA